MSSSYQSRCRPRRRRRRRSRQAPPQPRAPLGLTRVCPLLLPRLLTPSDATSAHPAPAPAGTLRVRDATRAVWSGDVHKLRAAQIPAPAPAYGPPPDERGYDGRAPCSRCPAPRTRHARARWRWSRRRRWDGLRRGGMGLSKGMGGGGAAALLPPWHLSFRPDVSFPLEACFERTHSRPPAHPIWRGVGAHRRALCTFLALRVWVRANGPPTSRATLPTERPLGALRTNSHAPRLALAAQHGAHRAERQHSPQQDGHGGPCTPPLQHPRSAFLGRGCERLEHREERSAGTRIDASLRMTMRGTYASADDALCPPPAPRSPTYSSPTPRPMLIHTRPRPRIPTLLSLIVKFARCLSNDLVRVNRWGLLQRRKACKASEYMCIQRSRLAFSSRPSKKLANSDSECTLDFEFDCQVERLLGTGARRY
ncbi:hypothetical protein FB451DRAFT_1180298 [Mycena latifolia]|nr:hypothetical protein FB451DRAFT_1180298 [Mycena latifolia]